MTAPKTCKTPMSDGTSCSRPVKGHGRCATHYQQWWREHGHLSCAHEGCTTPQRSKPGSGRSGFLWNERVWLCQQHEVDLLKPYVVERVMNLGRLAQGITPHGQCWIYAPTNDDGYGLFTPEWADKAQWLAHRALYDLLVGGHKHGLQLDHRACRNRACVAPHHLQPVAPEVNKRARGQAPGPYNRRVAALPAVREFAQRHQLPLPTLFL